MKTRLLYIFMLVILAAKAYTTEAAISDYSKEHPLLFGIDMDYPPLEYIDVNGQPSGYDVEFTNELLHRLGIYFTYSPNSWENICGDVLMGRVDLGLMVYSPYRKDSTNYSKAVFRLYYQIVYRKNDNSNFDVRNLSNKKVAYMASRPIRDTLSHVGAVLFEVNNLSQAMRDLSRGRYDAVICFRYQARYLIEKFELANLAAEDMTLTPREYCYVSHDKELIDAINAELVKMDAEGRIDAIYGDIYTSFDGIKIPDWIWYLLMSLVFVFLVIFILLQNRYQRQLRREMRRAQYSERMKTAFLGNVSHALRTPLNAIIGFSDILQGDEGALQPEERHHLTNLINTNGRQLLNFINDILKLSEIEGNELKLNRIEVALHDVIHGYIEEVKYKIKQDIVINVIDGANDSVFIDEQMMRFVTMHFLNNAIKHTEQGSITLAYRLSSGMLYVEVKDTGKGVPESLRNNIFNLLSEKSTYIQDEIPGLGLTICRAIVERCGGIIGYEQPEEGGSLFWYKIPVKVTKRG